MEILTEKYEQLVANGIDKSDNKIATYNNDSNAGLDTNDFYSKGNKKQCELRFLHLGRKCKEFHSFSKYRPSSFLLESKES